MVASAEVTGGRLGWPVGSEVVGEFVGCLADGGKLGSLVGLFVGSLEVGVA